MQTKLFTIPLHDAGAGEDELNRFLRGHRVLELIHQFVPDGTNSRWCFLVKYLDSPVNDRKSGGRWNSNPGFRLAASPARRRPDGLERTWAASRPRFFLIGAKPGKTRQAR